MRIIGTQRRRGGHAREAREVGFIGRRGVDELEESFFYNITQATALGWGLLGRDVYVIFFSGANFARGMNHTTHFLAVV
jgi:hypothetical protein